MGEAIITRAGGGEAQESIPITTGYCSILATLKTPDGALLKNYPLNCKDGNSLYNYTTNEKGQCLFVTNSGSANISVDNYINGSWIVDLLPNVYNVDAPISTTKTVNILFKDVPDGYVYSYNTPQFRNIIFYDSNRIDLALGGAGGGGSWMSGTSGGGGSIVLVNNININANRKMTSFNIFAGAGGARGYTTAHSEDSRNKRYWYVDDYYNNAGTGGTSTAFGYAAVGGGGGYISGNNAYAGVGANNGYYGNGGKPSNDSNYGGGGGKGYGEYRFIGDPHTNANFTGFNYGGHAGCWYNTEGGSILSSYYPNAGVNGKGGGGGCGSEYKPDFTTNAYTSCPFTLWTGENGGSGTVTIKCYK